MKPNRRGFFGILGALVGTKAIPEVAPLPPQKVLPLSVAKPLITGYSYITSSAPFKLCGYSFAQSQKWLTTHKDPLKKL